MKANNPSLQREKNLKSVNFILGDTMKKITVADIMKLPLQEVEWVDAASSSDIAFSELGTFKPHTISRVTMGRVIPHKEGVLIITDIQDNGKCEVWAVPKSFKPRILK